MEGAKLHTQLISKCQQTHCVLSEWYFTDTEASFQAHPSLLAGNAGSVHKAQHTDAALGLVHMLKDMTELSPDSIALLFMGLHLHPNVLWQQQDGGHEASGE